MIMMHCIIRLALIKVPFQCLVNRNKKSLQIIFIDKLREAWGGRCHKVELRNIHNNLTKCNNLINRHNNIIRQPTDQHLIKFIQMLDRDSILILTRFRHRHIIHNMMLTNIMSRPLTLMAWSKAERHQIAIVTVQDNL